MAKMRIGEKLVDVDMRNGAPVIKARAEEIKRADGSVDVVVHVPCIQLTGGQHGKSNL